MIRLRSVFLFPLLASLALAGCGSKQPDTRQQASTSDVAPVLDFLAASEQGATATLDDPAFGNGVRVVVEGRFFSALGDECKRATLISENREAEVVVICRQADGTWKLAPRIWGQGLSQ